MNVESKNRLLYMMHRAWVESRLLAQSRNSAQSEDLADVMELVPGIIAFENDEELAALRTYLIEYTAKYVTQFDYHSYLDRDPPTSY